MVELAMLQISDYTVLAKSLQRSEKLEIEDVIAINRLIEARMYPLGYDIIESHDILLKRPLFLMNFKWPFPDQPTNVKGKLAKKFKLADESKQREKSYFHYLERMLDEIPFHITFSISFDKVRENIKGYIIKVESEPAIIWKKRQSTGYNERNWLSKYHEIIDHNKRFIEDVLVSIGLGILEKPHTLTQPSKIPNSPLFDEEFLTKFPKMVRESMEEADVCYMNNAFRGCSVMLRTALEVALRLKYLQNGAESKLYKNVKDEIGLQNKLKMLPQIAPEMGQYIEEIEIMKWYGDKAAHDPQIPILHKNIDDNIEKFKAFLLKLNLK